mmetsp:Transcript_20171/g.38391  ORF Transcript_20171/g.38391 Transcript_20171/m.38391 type:complete len:236 (-) Transcript_20171:212-919(-)
MMLSSEPHMYSCICCQSRESSLLFKMNSVYTAAIAASTAPQRTIKYPIRGVMSTVPPAPAEIWLVVTPRSRNTSPSHCSSVNFLFKNIRDAMPAVRILRLFRICQVDGVMYSRAANEMLLITKYIKDGTMKRNVVLHEGVILTRLTSSTPETRFMSESRLPLNVKSFDNKSRVDVMSLHSSDKSGMVEKLYGYCPSTLDRVASIGCAEDTTIRMPATASFTLNGCTTAIIFLFLK